MIDLKQRYLVFLFIVRCLLFLRYNILGKEMRLVICGLILWREIGKLQATGKELASPQVCYIKKLQSYSALKHAILYLQMMDGLTLELNSANVFLSYRYLQFTKLCEDEISIHFHILYVLS